MKIKWIVFILLILLLIDGAKIAFGAEIISSSNKKPLQLCSIEIIKTNDKLQHSFLPVTGDVKDYGISIFDPDNDSKNDMFLTDESLSLDQYGFAVRLHHCNGVQIEFEKEKSVVKTNSWW